MHESGAKLVLTSLEKAVHVGEFDALVDIAKLAAEVLAELDAVLGELAAYLRTPGTSCGWSGASTRCDWLRRRLCGTTRSSVVLS